METSPATPKLRHGNSSLLVTFLGFGKSFAESEAKAHCLFLFLTANVWLSQAALLCGTAYTLELPS